MTEKERGPEVARLHHREEWEDHDELFPSAWEVATAVLGALILFALVSWGLVAWLG